MDIEKGVWVVGDLHGNIEKFTKHNNFRDVLNNILKIKT